MKQKITIIVCSIIIVLAIILIVVGLSPKKSNKKNENPQEQNEKLKEKDYEGYLTREERKYELQEEQKAILEVLKDKEKTKNYVITTSFKEYPYFIEKQDNKEIISYKEKQIKTINNEEEKSIIDRLIEYFEVAYTITKVEPTDENDNNETYITAMVNEDYNEFLKIIKETSYLKDDFSKYNKNYEKFYLVIYYYEGKPELLEFNLSNEDYVSISF